LRVEKDDQYCKGKEDRRVGRKNRYSNVKLNLTKKTKYNVFIYLLSLISFYDS